MENRYKIQSQRIGDGVGRAVEGKISNGMAGWTGPGYESEGDPWHCELALQQLEPQGFKPLSIPGVEGKDEGDDEEDQLLSSEQATRYRGITARRTYLAADRPDIQLSVK